MFTKTVFIILSIIIMSNIMIGQNISNELALMPYPESIKTGDGKFRITGELKVAFSDLGDRIHKASNDFLERLSRRTGIFFEFPIAKPFSDDEKINCRFEAEYMGKIDLEMKEDYTLLVDSKTILLKAQSDIGIIRGIQTLLQCVSSDMKGYYFPEMKIVDKPRFPWRGLMIDIVRHFMPLDVIYRNLDAMAAVKLNVLHLHLSDDQGFRVESKCFPKLHEMGSDGDYYTQVEIKKLIEYAGNLGIRVIPEFDVPGHSTSWFVGYPEYASVPGPYEIERKYGVKDPTFDPTKEETYRFLDKFFAEMSELFPDDYLHIGGDENNGNHWNANNQIQQYMRENNINDNHELQAYFNRRILEILSRHGKKMIGWDEILHKDIPNSIVIQSWRGKKFLVEAAKKGYNSLLSNGYYIDLMQPTEYHYLNEPIDESADLTEEEEKRILGGEMTMWTEWVTKENIDSRIWPRSAAIAERLWSPKEIRDVETLFRRLETVSIQIEDLGLEHISFQDKMLRRLTQRMDTEPLKILIDCVEPLQEYKRAEAARKAGFEFTQFSPYTRVIDAAIVDSKFSRQIKEEVNIILHEFDENTAVTLKNKFSILKKNHAKLSRVIDSNPVLNEIRPLSENLSKLAEVGLLALHHLNDKSSADPEWLKDAEKIIGESKISYGQVELIIVDPISSLIEKLR